MSTAKRAPEYDLKDAALVDLLDKHHAELRFAKFSPEIAFNLGLALKEAFLETYGDESIGRSAKPGVKKGLGVVIAIRTFNGHDLFSCVAGDASATGPDNWIWAGRKEKLVRQTGKSSFLVGRVLALQNRQPEDKGYPFPEYACHGGGFPIWLKNNTACPIGTILVSGLPQAEDHQL
ncbi:hypothetical protein FFLO_03864 [Filobasidium floriforme]|uniref:Uncharacterized protein n=2 Tax=Filobasidium floriforme TaxID=5210 RepID=A0A8K0NQD9_9TREE|nr:hypothetical protein FFLO_03864 [Filobasidium floriforme]